MKMTQRSCFALGCALLLALLNAAYALPTTNLVLSVNGPWRFTTNNVDAAAWTLPGYNDAAWSGPSNALFFMETATLPADKKTPLPPLPNGHPLPCYYFRASITVTNAAQVVALVFDHLVDDGAVFYLNGSEIQRVRMSAGTVVNATEANASPQDGDATSFETYSITKGLRTNLTEGVNVLAARVHQNGTYSTDVVFGSRVSVVHDPSPSNSLTRGPYLQVCTPSNIVIRWRTDLEESSLVRYGATPGSLNLSRSDATLATDHEVVVTNLAPDTRYYYSVGSVTRVLAGGDATCTFRTPPLPGHPKPLRIWATGDAGMANEDELAVRDAFETFNGTKPVDAWLQLGDNAYSDGTDAQYQAAMFTMHAMRLRQTPVWVTMGNHETYSTDWNGLYPYLNNFTMPTLGEAGGVASHTKLFYSFDIGLVHFVSLNSTDSSRASDGDMANWLRTDLAATTNRWLIAFFHHPPYTKGSHDSDSESELIEMRQNILPMLEAGGVDLVLCGHSHSYERSYFMNGHYGFSDTLNSTMILNGGNGRVSGSGAYGKPEHAVGTPIGNQGTVYAVVGSSSKTSGGTLDHPAMFVSLNDLGSLVLDISSNRLDALFLRETGATNDWFTITKTNCAPVASNQIVTVAADGFLDLLLGASDVNRNPVAFAISHLPSNGLASAFNPQSGQLRYTPAHGGTNGDAIGFTASDGSLSSLPGTVSIRVQAAPDTDGDGLPDAWETRYGVGNAASDPDGDGATNLQEYWAGTDPTNALSRLIVARLDSQSSGFQITWASVGGTRYRVLYSDGDGQGGFNGVFTQLPRAVTEEMDPCAVGTPGTMSFTDDLTRTGPPAHGCRYFRVSVTQ